MISIKFGNPHSCKELSCSFHPTLLKKTKTKQTQMHPFYPENENLTLSQLELLLESPFPDLIRWFLNAKGPPALRSGNRSCMQLMQKQANRQKSRQLFPMGEWSWASGDWWMACIDPSSRISVIIPFKLLLFSCDFQTHISNFEKREHDFDGKVENFHPAHFLASWVFPYNKWQN